jgi:hypothetical protein
MGRPFEFKLVAACLRARFRKTVLATQYRLAVQYEGSLGVFAGVGGKGVRLLKMGEKMFFGSAGTGYSFTRRFSWTA